MYRWLLAGLLGLTFTLSASAATYRYGTPVSVTGTLGSRQGVDCCNMGKEAEICTTQQKQKNITALVLEEQTK
jgi:hypothetical protein